MPKPTIRTLAAKVQSDVQAAKPEGQTIPRQTFLSILVQAYNATSLEAAERVIKTGEAAGYWKRRHDPKARAAFVVIPPIAATTPSQP